MTPLALPSTGWALLALLAAPAPDAPKPDVVFQAMRDELQRSVAELRLQGQEKPYFISYRVDEQRSSWVSATFGSTESRGERRRRMLNVEVRVGSPALDNTNFLSGDSFDGGKDVDLPLDDDRTELRRQIWLATDRAYKDAVESLSKKRAALQNKLRTDETPDFSPQQPRTLSELRPGRPLDLARAESLVRELSAVFREAPAVATSRVSLYSADELTRYVNSEGTAFTRELPLFDIEASADTQASDGFPLGDHLLLFRSSFDELPPKAELLAAVRELGAHLAELREAPLMDSYTGPVLFEGQAATEIFSQAFAPRLTARKRPVAQDADYESWAASRANPFIDKLGARVLSSFLSVSDDPSLTEIGGVPLLADERIDDEGVATRPVKLVEAGILKTLLVSRSPVRGVPESNGSFQDTGPAPRNLIVTASQGLEPAALKAELQKLAKQRGREYGVIVRRMSDPMVGGFHSASGANAGEGVSVEPVILAYKLFPDGHEELLRNAELGGIEASAFRDILAAGHEPFVSTLRFRPPQASSTEVVSFAVPALLFEELTLRRPTGEIAQPQIAKHPFFDR
jgi:predicted Zn-dependent protease